MSKDHPGLSPFTHRDDMTAGLHTSHPHHQEALLYGGDPPPVHKAEVILGPGPFGSPDYKTLGHRMNPSDDRPVSAPPLSPAFHQAQGTDFVTHYTDEEVLEMSKSELLDLCRDNDIPFKSSDSKETLLKKLGYGEDEDDEDSDDDS